MINEEQNTNIKNNELKIYLTDYFANRIQFCDSDRTNESQIMFSAMMKI